MSSFVGHLSAGVAVCLGHSGWSRHPTHRLLPVFALLAVLPDFDYFAWWFFKVSQEPRWTHSIALGLAAGTCAWFCMPARGGRSTKLLLALALASCSHPLLDLLVGVHPVPVFWPLPLPEVQSPLGVLPSAGHLSLTNPYLWRNLLIECGVLLPVLACLVAMARKVPIRSFGPVAWALLLPAWVAFVGWSVRIHA